MIFKPLSKRKEPIAERIVDAAYAIHIKLTGKRLGFLVNLNVPPIKNGIKRIILNLGVFVSLWLNYYLLKW